MLVQVDLMLQTCLICKFHFVLIRVPFCHSGVLKLSVRNIREKRSNYTFEVLIVEQR